MKPLIIIGASGNAHDVLDIVEALNSKKSEWQIVGFLDDGATAGSEFLGYPMLGLLTDAHRYNDHFFINSIGSERSFRQRPEFVTKTGIAIEAFATLIHPGAGVSSRATIGCGVYISYGASIGGNAVIGNHVSVAPGVIVGHDAEIDDFATLAPGAVISGRVQVGRAAYLGARCVVRQELKIGATSMVGMGAVVTRDTKAQSVVVGVPARPFVMSNGQSARPTQANASD